MKIREGFVSNSSSSSFVCIGVRFKAKDSKFYGDEDDKFHEILDDQQDYWDSEGDGGYVYRGAYKLVSDDDWDFGRVEEFDELRKKGFDKFEERLVREAHELYDVDIKKIEFGMWSGRVAS